MAVQPDVPRTRLEVCDLRMAYGVGSQAKQVLDGLTFDVYEREFVCVVGPSGAGKTTLLRCLCGLLPPTSGEAYIDGTLITEPPRSMALVFQEYTRSLMPWLTVERNVTMPLAAMGMSRTERRRRAGDALAHVGLAEHSRTYPWQLSGGMQQRVAIARALAYQPEVLVMDEPFASVDAQTRFELEDLTLRVCEEYGVTVVFVTHDVDEAVYLSNRIIVLSRSPCRVQEILEVDLPRPRGQVQTRALPRFAELRTHVLEQIKLAH